MQRTGPAIRQHVLGADGVDHVNPQPGAMPPADFIAHGARLVQQFLGQCLRAVRGVGDQLGHHHRGRAPGLARVEPDVAPALHELEHDHGL